MTASDGREAGETPPECFVYGHRATAVVPTNRGWPALVRNSSDLGTEACIAVYTRRLAADDAGDGRVESVVEESVRILSA